ncbi:MAG: hypothetical protein JRN42_08840 [Nitrososphaerota archaeon]|nr:hypothetical protein [Nitrososphaerota archaeon]
MENDFHFQKECRDCEVVGRTCDGHCASIHCCMCRLWDFGLGMPVVRDGGDARLCLECVKAQLKIADFEAARP